MILQEQTLAKVEQCGSVKRLYQMMFFLLLSIILNFDLVTKKQNSRSCQDPGWGARGARPPPIFGLAVPNLSPTLHARTPMTRPAPPYFQILDPPLHDLLFCLHAESLDVCLSVIMFYLFTLLLLLPKKTAHLQLLFKNQLLHNAQLINSISRKSPLSLLNLTVDTSPPKQCYSVHTHRLHTGRRENQGHTDSGRCRPQRLRYKYHHSNSLMMYSHRLKYQSINHSLTQSVS